MASELNRKLSAAIEHHQAGRLAEAVTLYDELLKSDPSHADANHLAGLVAFQQGRHDEALSLITAAIARDDGNWLYHANLGRVRKAMGEPDKAAESFARAISFDPGDAALHADLGGALFEAGRHEAGVESCRRAVELDPDLANAHFNLGIALRALGDVGDAANSLRRAGDLEPDFADAHFCLGELLQTADDLDGASEAYERALTARPEFIEARCNLGNVRLDQADIAGAIECYHAATAQDPAVAQVHANLGVALQESGDLAGALECYDQALRLDPGDAECRRNRAHALLQSGDFEKGWRELEWRWQTRHLSAIRRDWDKPQWGGGDFEGQTLLVHAEQGFGDCLHFARYLPLAAARGGTLVVECPDSLAELLGRIDGVSQTVAAGQELPAFDWQLPMLSLPGVFATDFDTMPADVPYLDVPESALEAWRNRVGGGGMNVGIVWKGSRKHKRDGWRSPGLTALAPLFEIEGVNWFSLQKDDGRDDLATASLDNRIENLGSDFGTFTDAAAAASHLDLVISPDTAAAHLAGALARPVWLMLPHASEWRWFADRDDSPWYPTMRLFRQPSFGDWAGVVTEVTDALKDLVGKG